MIFAFLLMIAGGGENALRVVLDSALREMYARLHGLPDILAETRQPDAGIVETMVEAVPDAALREEMAKPRPAMSLRSLVKPRWGVTTAAEVESVIQGGTAEERVARFKKRYPFGLLRFSAPGGHAFVTYEWLTARIDKHGDFHLAVAEIHLVELALAAQMRNGWTIVDERSVALE